MGETQAYLLPLVTDNVQALLELRVRFDRVAQYAPQCGAFQLPHPAPFVGRVRCKLHSRTCVCGTFT
eukprot:COSAG05_NODE_370_length_10716_cov_5.748422_8_plen_67_part_00